MTNVVFDDNYDSMGMFAKEMVDSEVRPKFRNEVDNKVKINVDMVNIENGSKNFNREDQFMPTSRSLQSKLNSSKLKDKSTRPQTA